MMPARAVPGTADLRGRELRDLRISVTDRCNLRCAYCMPRSAFAPGHRFLPARALMTPDQVERAARAFVGAGVRRIRLTGGEPLLRRELFDIVHRLAQLDIEDLALTTNGVLLSRCAARLRRAGLRRLSVSLDTLDGETFRRVSDVRVALQTVLDGIAAARDAGFERVKLNCVVRRGCNDSELERLVDFARAEGHTIRFIEYMDVGSSNGWTRDDVVPAREIVQRVRRSHGASPVAAAHAGEVARRYRFDDGREFGVIASVTEPFCAECTRARLSADAVVYTCLFAHRGTDIAPLLQPERSDTELLRAIRDIWSRRDDRYSELRAEGAVREGRVEMSYIGG
jgi:GTP 3',8-cyclase